MVLLYVHCRKSNTMGKTRDLKKIRDTKVTFLAKMGKVKDRNSMDLTEAEEIKKWQEYTDGLYETVLNDSDTMTVWSLT